MADAITIARTVSGMNPHGDKLQMVTNVVRELSGVSVGRSLSGLSVTTVTKDIDILCHELGCLEKHSGLGAAAAKARRDEEGPNELYKPKPPSIGILFLLQLTNIIIVLLIISGGAVQIFIRGPPEDRDQVWQRHGSF